MQDIACEKFVEKIKPGNPIYPFIHNRTVSLNHTYNLRSGKSKEEIYIFKKFINNSRGKYKRNECLINVCKSDTDLS
jgi:hypothetical protein